MLREDQQFYRAVVQYVELEREYNQLRGVAPDVPVEAAAPAGATQGEASMLTDYFQRSDVARVSGKISLSVCTAGTTGSYNVVARVRDESGEIKPIEFSETWQRDDAADVTFNADYSIGDDVELVSVRIRGLECTCTEPAQ